MIGYYPIVADCGVEILDIKFGCEDFVVYRFSGETKVREAQICYDESPYFNALDIRVYFDEVIKKPESELEGSLINYEV